LISRIPLTEVKVLGTIHNYKMSFQIGKLRINEGGAIILGEANAT